MKKCTESKSTTTCKLALGDTYKRGSNSYIVAEGKVGFRVMVNLETGETYAGERGMAGNDHLFTKVDLCFKES